VGAVIPGSIPSPDPTWSQIALGPLTIQVYALCLLAGMAAAVLLTHRRLTARGATEGVTLDIAIWAVPLGIVGARIYHVLTHLGDYTGPGADPWAWVRVWEGGIAVFGSLIGGAIGVFIGCRIAGLRFWSFADALAPALLLAQAIGRLGNYVNQELFGSPTTLPWGLEISPAAPMYPDGVPDGTVFHPLFLYEMLWNLAGMAVLLLLDRRAARRQAARVAAGLPAGPGLRWGRLFGLYLVWYGLGRSWLESVRIDPSSEAPLGVPINIWTAVGAILLGAGVFVVQGRRHPEPESSVHVPGRGPASDGEPQAENTPEPAAGTGYDVRTGVDPAITGEPPEEQGTGPQ
jgi:prolipoprotein diacylglyceryl transferase